MTSIITDSTTPFQAPVQDVEIHLTVMDLYSTSIQMQYTFHISPTITIGEFKDYLSPIFFYYPKNMDILLSQNMPYPLADKMQIGMLKDADLCDLILQPCGPPITPCINYITIQDNKTVLDLRNVPYIEFSSIPYWFLATPIQRIDLNADHPRIDEILSILTAILHPSRFVTSVESITFHRSFPINHMPLVTKTALFAFYESLKEGMTLNRLRIILHKNIVNNQNIIDMEFMSPV